MKSKLSALALILLVVTLGGGAYALKGERAQNIVESTATSGGGGQNEDKIRAFNERARFLAQNAAQKDGFALIKGGEFTMGSPESENWRGADERAHRVLVSDFLMSEREVTQAEYEAITGQNPSENRGADLPVENVSWLDAVIFANLKSLSDGLTPAYEITSGAVVWDRSANGYRLPSEAEWEYACRAGTTTPFYTPVPVGAREANYYSTYPYEIEENYFDNSNLKTRPQSGAGRTLKVGSFAPNPWGLYDMHGNVSEWCWDFYGAYDGGEAGKITLAGEREVSNLNGGALANPTGAKEGTRHIYRGGGWNDFGKNLRSAYRAAASTNYKSYSLGIRLVRNAPSSNLKGKTEAKLQSGVASKREKILIVFYSWGGNTRGVAREIVRQTGAKIVELELREPYSADYDECLMQAQNAQHRGERPALATQIEDFASYDTVLLGYPNWWASIPAPIATLLESYDFSSKLIVPFCSHGGGRMGQSVTAIAKLAPNADIGDALSVHYSGGASLREDVKKWLKANGI